VGPERTTTIDADDLRVRVERALATSEPAFGKFFLARLLDLDSPRPPDFRNT
jgi:hypothetical protein